MAAAIASCGRAAWWSTRAITTRSAPPRWPISSARPASSTSPSRRRTFGSPHAAIRARAAREPRRAAIDGDDALVERRQQRQQRALAGADVDRERAAAATAARAAGSHASSSVGRRPARARRARSSKNRRDSSSRCATIARDPREAAVLAAQRAAFLERGVDHRRPRRACGAEQRARAVAARGEQADLAQRLRLLGDLRLALAEQRGELADGQLLLGAQREQAQPVLVSEETEQIGARGDRHISPIYSIMRMMARAVACRVVTVKGLRATPTIGDSDVYGFGRQATRGSQPGRPAADTPQRLVVRSLDGGNDTTGVMGAHDTAVAIAAKIADGRDRGRRRGPAQPTDAVSGDGRQPS